MARKVSPFAALTNEEKQIKWLEYQSIRLPYTELSNNTSMHQPIREDSAEQTQKNDCDSHRTTADLAAEKKEHTSTETTESRRPIPPPEVVFHQQKQSYPSNNPVKSAYSQINELQRSRHNQYDAVIERMKKAEQRTGNYYHWSTKP